MSSMRSEPRKVVKKGVLERAESSEKTDDCVLVGLSSIKPKLERRNVL